MIILHIILQTLLHYYKSSNKPYKKTAIIIGLFIALHNSFFFQLKMIKFKIFHSAQFIVRICANGSAAGCDRPNVMCVLTLSLQKFGLTTDEVDPPDQACVEFCIQIRKKIKISKVPDPGSG